MLIASKNWVNHSHAFRRRYERKYYGIDIVFGFDGQIFQGKLRDIGLGGAYIHTGQISRFWVGDKVTVSIPFTNGQKHVRRTGRIAWKDNLGFAISFYE
ncbi:MAG: PilZ domain-containing protein [Desulfobacteraceae bacterium]|jgi:hypothetical protein